MYCENCGTKLSDDAKFCPNCGEKIKFGAAANKAKQETVQNRDIPGKIPKQETTGNNQKQGSAGNNQKKNNKNTLIGIVVIAVIGLVIGLYFMMSGGKNKTADSNSSTDADTAVTDDAGEQTETDKNSYEEILNRIAEKNNVTIEYVSSDVSDFPNVKVYFTAENNSGEAIRLTSPNVAVNEVLSSGEEIKRTIKSLDQLEGSQGVSFALAADKSGSMEYDLDDMKYIMTQFVNSLDYNTGDSAELIAFDTYVMYMCTFTTDQTLLENGINNMSTYGRTALYDALYEAVTNCGTREGARCVIAFTDGMDNESTHTAQEVINLANTYSVPIFIVGTDNGSGDFDYITTQTGGSFWYINSITDLSEILNTIYAQEKDMYCLEYTADKNEDPYSEMNIKIALEDDTYGASGDFTFTPTEALKTASHDSRYEVVKEDISWQDANTKALEKGGHLITITSQEEMDQASQLAQSAGLKYVWMGGYTSINGSETYGHWITGEPFEYTSWYPGEPSRNDQDGANEMYLMLWNVNDAWSWNDQRNDVFETGLSYFAGNVGYIIEYEN